VKAFLLTLAFVLAICAHAGIEPGSDLWKKTYDPPYVKPTEVPADSPLRKQLFDLLRPGMEKRAKQPLKFRGSLKVFRNWAYFAGDMLDQKDRVVRIGNEGLDYSVNAIWLHTKSGWVLVDGFDSWYGDYWQPAWFEKYNVPMELLGEDR
jgi:hypothetical protein